MIVVIDYGMGNLHSVFKALQVAGARAVVSSKAADIRKAKGIVFPGVGSFGEAMKELNRRKLVKPIKDAIAGGKPFLGLCLGLQLLFSSSEEGGVKGLGILPGRVKRFRGDMKVPHMGWNTIDTDSGSILFKGVEDQSFYFVHSFAAKSAVGKMQSWSTHGEKFLASVEDGYVSATQFHPEKSAETGEKILKNFLEL